MATTSVLSGLNLTEWKKEFYAEYIRDSGFAPYMGNSPMDIFHVVNDSAPNRFEKIRVPLLGRLKSSGVTGNTPLTGNEEQLDQYYQDVGYEWRRNAIAVTKKDQHLSGPDLMAPRRPRLKEWAAEMKKFAIIESLHKIRGVKYSLQSEAEKDAWVAANSDRVLFGAARSNSSSNDHSTSLANVDSTADKLSPEIAMLAKRMAKMASPHIRPFKTGTQGREFYVMFCHPLCFRDLKTHATMTAANRDARPRDVDSNPLFQDGDLIYDGIIFREIPEFYTSFDGVGVNTDTHLVGVGASSIDVGANFLCGAQTLGIVNFQAPTPVQRKEDDYGFISGVGIEMAWGMEKMEWDHGSGTRKDVGVVTVYCAAVGD
jgi:N4-gp56 family major capsid protein